MKKLAVGVLLIALMMSFLISCVRVPPGHVGLKVALLGDDRGEIQYFDTGRYAKGLHTEWHLFPTFNQNYVWTQDLQEGSPNDESFNFAIKGGLIVGLDLGIEYTLEPNKIPAIFEQYRYGVEELTDVVLRKAVRNSLQDRGPQYDIDSLVEGGLSELATLVNDDVKAEFGPKGIFVHRVSMIGAPRYPSEVTHAITAKIEATQKAIQRENELRAEEAEARKLVARAEGEAQEKILLAEAEAKANSIVAKSITSQIIQMEFLKKWDGKLPQYLGSEKAIPFIQAK